MFSSYSNWNYLNYAKSLKIRSVGISMIITINWNYELLICILYMCAVSIIYNLLFKANYYHYEEYFKEKLLMKFQSNCIIVSELYIINGLVDAYHIQLLIILLEHNITIEIIFNIISRKFKTKYTYIWSERNHKTKWKTNKILLIIKL